MAKVATKLTAAEHYRAEFDALYKKQSKTIQIKIDKAAHNPNCTDKDVATFVRAVIELAEKNC